ncbi:MAG: hypothetical protein Q8O03_04355 [Nanoarchaeota archaeon]|nr:hypothetical protein [Nanoarchaeota archaeon]
MAVCPKCSYTLVLLQHRNKYKCALCSRLFPQKEIDDREFKEWNKRQRLQDAENYERERKEKLAKMRELKRGMKHLFNGLPQSSKEYYTKNKDKIQLKHKEWGLKNREKISQKCKEYRLKNREKDLRRKQEYYQKNKQIISFKEKVGRKNNLALHNQRKRNWRDKNLETMRTYGLIQHYRRKQKALALQYLKNDEYKPSSAEIFHSVPTYSLSYLLVVTKNLYITTAI